MEAVYGMNTAMVVREKGRFSQLKRNRIAETAPQPRVFICSLGCCEQEGGAVSDSDAGRCGSTIWIQDPSYFVRP